MLGTAEVTQLKTFSNTFSTHRKMGVAESLYRLIADMHVSLSNIKTVFVLTGFPENRYIHAELLTKNINDENFKDDDETYQIKVWPALYRDIVTMLSICERRGTNDNLNKLTFA